MAVTKETLKEWLQLLEEDKIGQAMVAIEKAINGQMTKDSSKGLTFEQIQVGEVYRFVANPNTKKYLHGVQVEVTDKKIKNVTGVLKQSAGSYKVGSKFSIPPSALEEVK